jgi:hypothetical protein
MEMVFAFGAALHQPTEILCRMPDSLPLSRISRTGCVIHL